MRHGPARQINTRTQLMARRHPNGRACADVLQRLAQQPLAQRLRHPRIHGPLRPANLRSALFAHQPANAAAPPPRQHQRSRIRRRNNPRPAHVRGGHALSLASGCTPQAHRHQPGLLRRLQLLTGALPPPQASGYKTLLAHRQLFSKTYPASDEPVHGTNRAPDEPVHGTNQDPPPPPPPRTPPPLPPPSRSAGRTSLPTFHRRQLPTTHPATNITNSAPRCA